MKKRCKRQTVWAMGIDETGRVAAARNYSPDECSGQVGNCGCVHAEMALLQEMPNPYKVVVSHSPCLQCAKALVDAGVEVVAFMQPYRLPDGERYLLDHGVTLIPIAKKGGWW